MSRNLHELFSNDEDSLAANRSDFFNGLEGIVVDNNDPENQHRIKCKFEWHDANRVHDVWIPRMVVWTGPDGYGDYHPPAIGSEVLVWGRLGEKTHLFYTSRYNENFRVPEEFQGQTDVMGFKCAGGYKELVGQDHLIKVGGNQTIQVTGNQIIEVTGSIAISGESLVINCTGRIDLNAPGGVFANGTRLA